MQLKEHSHTDKQPFDVNLILYCFIFFSDGLFDGILGPLIPYLSQKTGIQQTEYSFIFLAQAAGAIIGIIINKLILNRVKEHHIIAVGTISLSLSIILFAEVGTYLGGWISITLQGFAAYCSMVTVNICLVRISAKKPGRAPFAYAMHGVGALISPQIIRFLKVNTLLCIAPLFIIAAIFSFYLPSPQNENTQIDQHSSFKYGSIKLQCFISLAFFLMVGVEVTITGWLPTYAVQTQVCSSSQATLYSTIFWSINTLFRFINAAVPSKTSSKLKVLLCSLLICCCVCIIMQEVNNFGVAAMFAAIGYGLSCSGNFPLLLTLSDQFEIKFTRKQWSNIMISTVLAGGILTSTTGMLMKNNINLLFYSLTAMSILLALIFLIIIRISRKEQREKAYSSELLQDSIIEQ